MRTAGQTARNYHTDDAGVIMGAATAFPGNTGVRAQSVVPLDRVLG